MPNRKRTPSPITDAVADADDALAALLAAALPPPLRAYNAKIEITVNDLAKSRRWSINKARNWLRAEVDAGRWQCEQVADGPRPAFAFRPVVK